MTGLENITLDQISRIPSFITTRQVFQSKIMLLNKDTNIAYGVILIVKSQINENQDKEFSENLEKMIENICTVIGGCISNLDLIDTIEFVQEALKGTYFHFFFQFFVCSVITYWSYIYCY